MVKKETSSHRRWRHAKPLTVATAFVVGMVSVAASAQAADDAKAILKAMSDYLAGQKAISASFDTSIEVITPALEKIQFNNSGTLLLQRPNELYATRTGGYADVALYFDGKTATAYGK